MDKEEQAKQNFLAGYNCSQAVLLAFADELNIDKETILKLTSSFGAGMGRQREVCGAVSAMNMMIGLKKGYTDAKDIAGKTATYQTVQDLDGEFKEEIGSIVCREILGVRVKENATPEKRDDAYYKKRSCLDCVGCAARLIEKNLIK